MSELRIYMHNTLGRKVPVKIPFATSEEYDRLVGTPGAWWDTVCANECYSNFAGDFGDKVVEALKVLTISDALPNGREVPVDPKKPKVAKADGTDVPQLITPKHYIALVLAEKLVTEAQVDEVFAKVAEAMPPLDVSPSKRGGNKPSKEWLDSAATLIATLKQKGRDLADWFAVVESKYPGAPRPSDEEGFTDVAVARILIHAQKAKTAAMADE